MINYWPTEDMEVYLRLQSRVQARMALADAAATGSEDPLNELAYEQAHMELNFRDQQLKQLREEGTRLRRSLRRSCSERFLPSITSSPNCCGISKTTK